MLLRLILLLLVCATGARGELPWNWQPIACPEPPPVKDAGWYRGEIDRFLLARMEAAGITPAPVAEPGTLLRRLSLDLTGLPPTRDEAAAFARDPSAAAYAQAVDRLLDSPHFGERWAVPWLDAARYADTQGYEKDNMRLIWAWRDWVIRALNEDLPFDRFTIEQLAGDLLPSPTPSQLMATAFHRNTMTNTEGGTNAEEFRVKAVIDRVNTTWQTWLGVSFACAQCHDHPSLPLSQRDYYAFFAFFNNTEDANDADDRPVLDLETTSVPVLRELPPDKARITHLCRRGNWLEPLEAVTPATPAALPPMPASAPRNRLGLAQWIASAGNPLTARVVAGRLWSQLFGQELEAGKHRELLDFLAYRFSHELGWSQKGLIREMVLSAAYRQSAKVRAEDPSNALFSRAARRPLTGEMLRDQALAASGLLSAKMYGRSVMPPQPDGVWQVVYNIQRWIPSRGEDRWRRSLYTFWRRTSPFPALALLEVPTRESCTIRREPATGPMAALVLLNDETFAEAARAFAQRMEREGGATFDAQLAWGYETLLCRQPAAEVLAGLRGAGDVQSAAIVLLNLEAACTRD